ncbi:MAG: hypothetical protein K0M48_01750 [Thiobacillus sp.]|nr:hypothetical protein [Thiobacillus sp.]
MLLSACSTTSNVPLSSPLKQPPAVETHPGSIAILYAENLRHHRCIAGKGYIAASWTIELGAPSIGMFDRIFSALFENPVGLQADAASQIPANSKGVIEVGLLKYDGCEVTGPIGRQKITVAYQATLRAREGSVIARWEGHGRAGPADNLEGYTEKIPFGEVETRYLGALTSLAMRRAAADFVINFERNPSLRAWLEK